MTEIQPEKHYRLYPSFYELNKQQSESLYINTLENAIDSLETGLTFFQRNDNFKWKWIAISLHHALYSFAVACLAKGSSDQVFVSSRDEDDHRFCMFMNDGKWKKSKRISRENSPAYTIIWNDTDEDPTQQSSKLESKQPSGKLISIWTALARVQDSYFWMGRSVVSKALSLNEDELKGIEWLALEARNKIVHFVPITHSYPIDKFKETSLHVVRAIEFLALRSNSIMYIHYDESKKRITDCITQLRTLLS
jgi:hypothetical protein